MRLAVKLGGSIALTDQGPSSEYAVGFRSAVQNIDPEKLVVGIGGGHLARNYLRSIGKMLSPEDSEKVVIQLLRANTQFMALVLGGFPIFEEQDLESVAAQTGARVLVIGGIKPGRSTDANTALLAEAVRADLFVKMTDVEGVYTGDPDVDPEAHLLREMSYDQAWAVSLDGKPGSYGVLDRLSLQVLKRAQIPVRVINGRDPQNLVKLISGEEMGTLIGPRPSQKW